MNKLAYCMHENQDTWPKYDARGLYLAKVCDLCVDYKMSQFRPEVLTDSQYECDEPIEEDS